MKEAVVNDFADWRRAARECLRHGIGPAAVRFTGAEAGQHLLLTDERDTNSSDPPVARGAQRVPPAFLSLAEAVSLHRDGHRWDLLYRLLWRLTHGEPHLLEVEIDEDVRRARLMEKAVRRDMHKMRAFVRFREVAGETGTEYVAWYRPDHLIVKANAPFFVRRFGSLRWAILTPDASAYWDGEEVRFGPGAPQSSAPAGDALEELWRAYYASTFNPARANLRMMRAEMPVRHWATLPESQVIHELLRNAGNRVVTMIEKQKSSAREFVPPAAALPELAGASQRCEGCDLFRAATQTVFGEGPPRARVVMVGEQPGDEEDVKGRPFVGPAGRLLDKALAEAGVDRSLVYVTNAVKHFKFEERGKRRIHKKPSGTEISACRPWLEAELEAIRPELIVCLGSTAAQALAGRDVRIGADRGRFLDHHLAPKLMVTIHPSALLRMPEGFDEEYARFVADLVLVRDFLKPR
ncbi:MAG: UdgX family uracil-DNA binding protein [Bryobacteraceae bacterium]|nr:UdgX family uracil-DNA binding protein [Bryobacteraceae bacterium]